MSVPKVAPKGLLFLVPVGASRYVVGLISHVGRSTLRLGVFACEPVELPIDEEEARMVLQRAPLWKTRMNLLGFKRGGWREIGQIAVPAELEELPLFRDYEGANPFKYDPQTLLPICQVEAGPNDEVVEGGLPGDLYIVQKLQQCCGLPSDADPARCGTRRP